ncbi:hypothetical protein G6F56_010649 [Rhizopus delemar]|nr:hypothetical protein G6F56_010649 [Rhizopus delemar]
MIAHTGESMHSGHYISYVKSSNGIWYCMDNDNVQQVSVNRLLSEKASMLFYHVVPEPVKRQKVVQPVKVKSEPIEKEQIKIEAEKEQIKTQGEEEEEKYIKDESDDERDAEKEKLKLALEQVTKKEKVENRAAIVVSHDENMKSKRDKFQDLIEKESLESKSSEAKQALLSKTLDGQFQDSISAWDEDVGVTVENQRKDILKNLKTKRKRVDSYNLEYDTGKVKKVKKKQEDKFNKPNMFQITANMKQNKKKK